MMNNILYTNIAPNELNSEQLNISGSTFSIVTNNVYSLSSLTKQQQILNLITMTYLVFPKQNLSLLLLNIYLNTKIATNHGGTVTMTLQPLVVLVLLLKKTLPRSSNLYMVTKVA